MKRTTQKYLSEILLAEGTQLRIFVCRPYLRGTEQNWFFSRASRTPTNFFPAILLVKRSSFAEGNSDSLLKSASGVPKHRLSVLGPPYQDKVECCQFEGIVRQCAAVYGSVRQCAAVRQYGSLPPSLGWMTGHIEEKCICHLRVHLEL